VPESKPRKKSSKDSGTAEARAPRVQAQPGVNPRWLVPTMLTLFVAGTLWVVIFYLTSGGARLPIPPIGQWNIAVGFALILAGFGLATRWR